MRYLLFVFTIAVFSCSSPLDTDDSVRKTPINPLPGGGGEEPGKVIIDLDKIDFLIEEFVIYSPTGSYRNSSNEYQFNYFKFEIDTNNGIVADINFELENIKDDALYEFGQKIIKISNIKFKADNLINLQECDRCELITGKELLMKNLQNDKLIQYKNNQLNAGAAFGYEPEQGLLASEIYIETNSNEMPYGFIIIRLAANI
ncbi:MAG: hypothetical protein ACOC2K_04985 [Bacteroidota bacterium]